MNLEKELQFKMVRSSGKGGQNVNKVATKVLLQWNINTTQLFDIAEITRIKTKLKKRISANGLLQIHCQDSRSQGTNKQIAIARLHELVETALIKPKTRIPTKTSKAAKRKRLAKKRQHSQKKAARKKVNSKNHDAGVDLF